MTLREEAAAWLAAGRTAVVVEVVEHRGSVPRETGTRMLVAAEAVAGTIGGGRLEQEAIAHARSRLGRPEAEDVRVALGPTLGQCCGGALTLRHAPLDAEAMRRWAAVPPRFVLQLYGAGHVGRAIVAVLAGIDDVRVQWIDEREHEFPDAPLPAHIERVAVDAVEAEVDAAPPGACFLVVTHSHALDLRIVEAVLRRGDFGFLGLIGSRSKRARFEHQLRERGIALQRLERLVCPIGLPGVGGKAPGDIAVAAVAQLLQRADGR